jgi:hypothetical protein
MVLSKVINLEQVLCFTCPALSLSSVVSKPGTKSIIFCRMKWLGLFAFIVFFSCSSSRMIETNLYFGQSRPDGSMITKAEWNGFKQEYIDKVFKEGSSVINVAGSWYDPSAHKLITEPTYMVIYHYKRSLAISRQIDSLCYWYKKIFIQQAVLRVDKKVKATFL